MTTPEHLDDEQLTALQDGDGAAADGAHLASCEACRARAEALAEVVALVAAPPPAPSADARDDAVAAALRAADRPAVVHRHRPRRRRRPQVPAWLAPAAAVVVLLALVAVVVPQLGSRDTDDSAASGRATAGDSGDDAETGSGGGAQEAQEEDNALRLAGPGPDLGPVEEEADLARRVDDALADGAIADAPATSAARDVDCSVAFQAAGQPLGPLRLRATLTWQGQPAEVLSDGDRAVVVVAGGCATLASVDLP